MKLAVSDRAKHERIADRAKAQELKPLRQLLGEAQGAFNAFIRERDSSLPCISCGRFHEGQWHAGHYLSTSARPALRFDESNVHRQCQPCNAHLSGNLAAYRLALVHRIGAGELSRLENTTAPRKWTREELTAIKTIYSAKRRALLKSATTQPETV
jgi:hypothetical protein